MVIVLVSCHGGAQMGRLGQLVQSVALGDALVAQTEKWKFLLRASVLLAHKKARQWCMVLKLHNQGSLNFSRS